MEPPPSLSIPLHPTTSLPPLGKLSIHCVERIKDALQNLRTLYFSQTPSSAFLDSKFNIPKRSIQHPIHDKSVPDSGYASAEEDDEDEISQSEILSNGDSDNEGELEVLRADPFERAFSIKWLTGLITRSDMWLETSISDEDSEIRTEVLEDAASLLSSFTGGEGDDDAALTRTFSFSVASISDDPGIDTRELITVELNDAPLSKDDHTSVGLQSWGSSILLANRFCLEPETFHLSPPINGEPLRILELGAGTGMLSIVASKILRGSPVEIIATDYHPDVLENLSKNVATNFPSSEVPRAPIIVTSLDWEHPHYIKPLDSPFDIILAADVIYHPSHAEWIKRCVERLLTRPDPSTGNPGGVFWLIIPVRTTGRHEGMDATVDILFPDALAFDSTGLGSGSKLAAIYREQVGRQSSIGRADEGAYRLFKIGWIN